MATGKHECDLCKRKIMCGELIACDECYYKIEKQFQTLLKALNMLTSILENKNESPGD